MKYALILIVLAVAVLSGTTYANALLVAETPLELYYHHELILVGEVISLIENSDGIAIEYNIKVEEYVKNPKPYDMITVFGTYYSIPSPPKFEVKDRVLLLLNKDDNGRYEISSLSFKAKAGCDAHQMLGMQTFPDEPLARGQPQGDFRIDENCLGPVEKPSGVWFVSPLKQFKSGIAAQNVQCKEGLQLIMKISNVSPVCVRPETKEKLIERGWTKDGKEQFVKISLGEFKNVHSVGSPINDFIIKLEGYFPTYNSPDIKLEDEAGNIVWTNYDDIGHVYTSRVSSVEFCKEYRFYDIGDPLIINKTGTYKFIFSFEGFSIEKEIKIRENVSDVSIDKKNEN